MTTRHKGYEAPALTLVLVAEGVRATDADNTGVGSNSDGSEPDGLWE